MKKYFYFFEKSSWQKKKHVILYKSWLREQRERSEQEVYESMHPKAE